jgi:hypothetical protein
MPWGRSTAILSHVNGTVSPDELFSDILMILDLYHQMFMSFSALSKTALQEVVTSIVAGCKHCSFSR